MPQPPDDTSLNLGVAALRRFLAYAPNHAWAVKAAYEIGEAYLARGKSQEALEAFGAFLKEEGFRAESDDAKRDLAERLMTAAFQVGQDPPGAGEVRRGDGRLEGVFDPVPQRAAVGRCAAGDPRYPAPDGGRPPAPRAVCRGAGRLAGVRCREPAR